MKYYSKNYKNLNSVFTVKVRLYSSKYFLLFMFSSFFFIIYVICFQSRIRKKQKEWYSKATKFYTVKFHTTKRMIFFKKLEAIISVVWLDNPKGSNVIPRPNGRGITFDPFGLSSHTKEIIVLSVSKNIILFVVNYKYWNHSKVKGASFLLFGEYTPSPRLEMHKEHHMQNLKLIQHLRIKNLP